MFSCFQLILISARSRALKLPTPAGELLREVPCDVDFIVSHGAKRNTVFQRTVQSKIIATLL